MRNLFARLMLVCAIVMPLSLSTSSCTALHSSLAPDEVVLAVDLRSNVWEGIETAWPATDEELVAALKADSSSWGLLEDSAGMTAPAKYKAVVQSQKLATKVAAAKVEAGQYSDAEKLELVQALRKAWGNLEGYFDPAATPVTEE